MHVGFLHATVPWPFDQMRRIGKGGKLLIFILLENCVYARVAEELIGIIKH